MSTHPTARQLGAAILSSMLAAAALVGAGSAGAHTEDLGAPVKVSVAVSDLDLTHAAGAGVMRVRIQAAATRACGGAPDPRLLDRLSFFDQCRKQAIAGAVDRLDTPLVKAEIG
jgi:UrcA family protein